MVGKVSSPRPASKHRLIRAVSKGSVNRRPSSFFPFLALNFGPKRDEATGEWRKLHSGELHNLYSSPDIIRQIKSRRMRWAGHVERMGEGRNMYRVLVGKPEGKRPLERPRRRWEDGIKTDLREIGWGVWSGFIWLRIGTVGGLM
jgi:hypothetical protein